MKLTGFSVAFISVFITLCNCALIYDEYSTKAEVLDRRRRVTHGFAADKDDYRWQVSLQTYEIIGDYYKHYCGATLIAGRWVLSAGHCVRNREPEDVFALVGSYHVKTPETAVIGVSKIFRHPEYQAPNKDISLLLLKEEVPLNRFDKASHADVIQLPLQYYVPDDACNMTGWGRLERKGPTPSVLMYTRVEMMPHEKCAHIFRNATNITDFMLCFGGRDGDACQGDSGGPLACRNSSNVYLAGIASFGVGCATPGVPGVYTRLDKFADWINNTIHGEYLKEADQEKILNVTEEERVITSKDTETRSYDSSLRFPLFI